MAGKKERGEILDEFMKLTGYQDRSHAAFVLRYSGKRVRVGSRLVIEGDAGKRAKRKRVNYYDEDVRAVLKLLWPLMDYICGKRLKEALPEIVPRLLQHGEVKMSPVVREKLSRISAATIDRLLKPERDKLRLKGRSGTKPGTLLKHQIPIRTFAEWNEARPGFVEIDLVSHEGGNSRGDFIQSLDITDVNTGWTEVEAVKNKAQVWVFEALKGVRKRLPFELLGIDSDNGAEFINRELANYCIKEGITFTRTRSHPKNDNCYIEQKNYSIVRRAVGYRRYDTVEELELLNKLYGILRLYNNFFMPSMKLVQKIRNGAKVTKQYDKPTTPYHRVMDSPYVSQKRKEGLSRLYESLNPAELKREITRLQLKLERLATVPVMASGTKQSDRVAAPKASSQLNKAPAKRDGLASLSGVKSHQKTAAGDAAGV